MNDGRETRSGPTDDAGEGGLKERSVGACSNCGQVYAVRTDGTGRMVVPTADGDCACGNGAFEEVGQTALREDTARRSAAFSASD
jgi:hypothetical protein